MPWLFRVFSDASHASNGPTGFAPAAATSRGGNVNAYHAPEILEDMKAQLTLAISGRKTAFYNPFIFFTPSLLLALQFAHFRKGGFFTGVQEQNISITCFDSDRAQTPHGKPVRFACMEEMVREYGIEMLDNGIRRGHLAEYVTMDCVVLDGTARTASLDDILDQGLYRLYPAIQEATNNTKYAPRVNRELDKLRAFCFDESGTTVRPCDSARIDLAAKVASTFRSTNRSAQLVEGHLLAWMLSLTKRDAVGQEAIAQWLEENAYPRPSDLMEQDASFLVDATTMPEVQQFFEILPMMSNIAISNQVLSATTSISAKDNQKELFDWRDQQQVNNIQYNEERKVKQAAKAAEQKEKNAVKKARAAKAKDAEAAKKQKDKEKAQKKRAADNEAKVKRMAKAAKKKVTDEKDKKRRAREKAKRAKDKAKREKEKAKLEKQKIANEKVQAVAEKKLAVKDKKIEALEGNACPDEDSWMM